MSCSLVFLECVFCSADEGLGLLQYHSQIFETFMQYFLLKCQSGINTAGCHCLAVERERVRERGGGMLCRSNHKIIFVAI